MSHQPRVLALVGVDRLDDPGRFQRRVVVAARGVVDDRRADPVVVLRTTASQRLVGAPFRPADDGGRLAGHHDPGRRRPLRLGRRLRRGDEDGGDVLRVGLFLGSRPVSQAVVGCRRRGSRLGRRRVDRAGDRDLDGPGGADEQRIRAAGPSLGPAGRAFATRRAAVGRRGFVLGLIPGSPRSVGAFCAHPGGGSGEVAGQRDQRKRGVLGDFANRDATPEPDQRLLGDLGVAGPRAGQGRHDRRRASPTHDTITTVAAMAVSNIVGARLRDDTS